MPYTRNHVPREPKSSKKKKSGKDQLQNVISLHINDDEKRMLEKLTKSTSKSITEIMRGNRSLEFQTSQTVHGLTWTDQVSGHYTGASLIPAHLINPSRPPLKPRGGERLPLLR